MGKMKSGAPHYTLPGGGTIEFSTFEARTILSTIRFRVQDDISLKGYSESKYHDLLKKLEEYLGEEETHYEGL